MLSMAWWSWICERLSRRCWSVTWGARAQPDSGRYTRHRQVAELPLRCGSFSRAQPGCLRGQDAGLRRFFERLVKVFAQTCQFFLIHQFLHALKELAFLLTNVGGHALS